MNPTEIIKNPLLLKSFFSGASLQKMQDYIEALKISNSLTHDKSIFHRRFIRNDHFFTSIHTSLVLPIAEKIYKTRLRPSFSFVSLYGKDGICPPHTDQPDCYLTISVCLNQKSSWDFFIQFPNSPEYEWPGKIQTFKLEIGDALGFHGQTFLHWRDRISPDNFCDVVFFHFLPGTP